MYKSILVPVDIAEPELAEPAIKAAVSFAKISGGAIRLVYVRSLVPITYMEFVPADFDAGQQEDAQQTAQTLRRYFFDCFLRPCPLG